MPASASGKLGVQRSTPGSLEVIGLTKRFSGMEHAALADVGLRLAPGRFLSLIGPSGCGKTTLLRIIAGLETPTEGQVFVDGEPSPGPSRDKSIVFQHFNLFPWRSARDNVAYGLEMQNVGKSERREIADRYLALMGLSGFEGHYPHQLSGGMQQRVGLARALVVRPKVLLMDEPFGALDALTRESLQIELEKICGDGSVTVIFVTHSIDEAVYLSDEVVVMGRGPGRIVEHIPIDLERPRWRSDIRATESFGRLRGHIWTLLQKEMARGDDAGAPVRAPSYE